MVHFSSVNIKYIYEYLRTNVEPQITNNKSSITIIQVHIAKKEKV